MGYDCTPHLVDEAMIRDRFVPRLLGQSSDRSAFDDDAEAEELWSKVCEALARMENGEQSPATVANFISQLAIAYCASELPYHYERGFCLSLWPDQPESVAANVPEKFPGGQEVEREYGLFGWCGEGVGVWCRGTSLMTGRLETSMMHTAISIISVWGPTVRTTDDTQAIYSGPR